jgi:hypothetical protein
VWLWLYDESAEDRHGEASSFGNPVTMSFSFSLVPARS